MAAGRLEATMLAAGLSIQAAPVPKSWANPPAHGLSPDGDDPDGAAGSSGEEEAGDSVQELRKREPLFSCGVANQSCSTLGGLTAGLHMPELHARLAYDPQSVDMPFTLHKRWPRDWLQLCRRSGSAKRQWTWR